MFPSNLLSRDLFKKRLDTLLHNQRIFRIIFIIILVFLFVNFNPSSGHDSKLAEAMLSTSYRDVLFLSLGVGIPSVLDLSLDVLFTPAKMFKLSYNGFVARSINVSSMVVCSSYLLYLNILNIADTDLYWSFLNFGILGMATSALIYLNALSGEFWSHDKVSIILTFAGLSLIFNLNDQRISSMGTVLALLSMISILLSYIYYSFQIYRWYHMSLQHITTAAITPNLACSVFYAVILQLGFLTLFILHVVNYNDTSDNMSTLMITGYQYGLISAMVLMSLVHSQGVRLKDSSAQDSLEYQRLIIRYISHEMRNPINTVSVGLTVLPREITSVTKKPLPQEALEVMQDMLLAKDTILRILDDLLTYEKLQEEEHKLNFYSVKLWYFVQHECKKSLKKCLHRDVKLKFEIIGDKDVLERAAVKADPEKLAQVVEKLTMNAVKVTPPGGTVVVRGRLKSIAANATQSAEEPVSIPTQRPRTSQVTRPKREEHSIRSALSGRSMRSVRSISSSISMRFTEGEMIHIDIVDGGPRSVQNFQDLSNFDMKQLDGGQGYGLGLWICRRLVELHNGVIGLDASDNSRRVPVGSSFFFELPVLLGSSVLPSHYTLAERNPNKFAKAAVKLSVVQHLNSYRMTVRGTNAVVAPSSPSSHVVGDTPGSAGAVENSLNHPVQLTKVMSHLSSSQIMLPAQSQEPTLRGSSKESVRHVAGSRSRSASASGQLSVQLCATDSADQSSQPKDDYDPSVGVRVRVSASAAEERPIVQQILSTIRNKGSVVDGDRERKHTSCVLGSIQDEKANEEPSGRRGSIRAQSIDHNAAIGRCCLVVDDVRTNRKMLMRLLREQFGRFDEAEDGVQAVAKVKASMVNGPSYYDVILMDFIMPNKDGPTATAEIRELGFNKPIFAVTGNAQQRDIDHFIASGANRVFTKPLDVAEFRLVIADDIIASISGES